MVLTGVELAEAYGQHVATALRQIREPVFRLADRFVGSFYESLTHSRQTAEVIRRLSSEEFSRLRRRQAEHLIMLLDPDLTPEVHETAASRAGSAHALVGVDVLWLVEAFNLYQQEIQRFIPTIVPTPDERELLIRCVSRRVLFDLEAQIAAYRRVEEETTSALSQVDHFVLRALNFSDLVRGVLNAISSLSGALCGFFSRPDEDGNLQIEASFGTAAEDYRQAMADGRVPKISTDAKRSAGHGPGGRAWRSGKVVVSDSWAKEAGAAPWRPVGIDLGFRSSAAVPITDELGRPIALVSVYSAWPGYFSTNAMQSFLAHIKQVLSHSVQQRADAPVIPIQQRHSYRQLLEERRSAMLYQPIISLNNGALVKVEALARIKGYSGTLISPQQFLPAFGENELWKLFDQGLHQVCIDYNYLVAHGIDVTIAINFPAEGVADKRYEEVLVKTVWSNKQLRGKLQLELLETKENHVNDNERQEFIKTMRRMGVNIVLDDLGSGHSSLLRLDQYPFDEVKIDQGLVRSALQKPRRALEFVVYLTRLVHSFDMPVVVEGLEKFGLLEAAAILGADYGQGYGIARPMSIEALVDWNFRYEYPVEADRVTTALGAMACYLLWDIQVRDVSDEPRLNANLVGPKAILGRFLQENGFAGSTLDELLRLENALSFGDQRHDVSLKSIRDQVIQQLTKHWLNEI